jgi:hypothetical protein
MSSIKWHVHNVRLVINTSLFILTSSWKIIKAVKFGKFSSINTANSEILKKCANNSVIQNLKSLILGLLNSVENSVKMRQKMRLRGLTLQPIFNLTTHAIHVSIDAFSPFTPWHHFRIHQQEARSSNGNRRKNQNVTALVQSFSFIYSVYSCTYIFYSHLYLPFQNHLWDHYWRFEH